MIIELNRDASKFSEVKADTVYSFEPALIIGDNASEFENVRRKKLLTMAAIAGGMVLLYGYLRGV